MADLAATKAKCVTLADLCQAISSRELPVKQDGDWYVVRRNDVKALADRLEHRDSAEMPLVQAS
jgi:hypothetical protein